MLMRDAIPRSERHEKLRFSRDKVMRVALDYHLNMGLSAIISILGKLLESGFGLTVTKLRSGVQ